MINQELLNKYADLAIKSGCNIQKGQLLIINAPVDCAFFARVCAQKAYEAGAGRVVVQYNDENLSHLDYLHVATDELKKVSQWQIDRKQEQIDNKCCMLHIDSKIPSILQDIEPSKIQEVMMSLQTAMKKFRYYTMADHGQWCIVAIPNLLWAKKVFPELNDEQAVEKLWDAILKSVMVNEESDAVNNWDFHNQQISKRATILNDHAFKAIKFKNDLGTDLCVGLVENHIWAGGDSMTVGGVKFNPNMPTEEIFTMPHKYRVNGKVVSTKPLNYNGVLVEDFEIDFVDGKAVSYSAKNNQEALANLINLDEGSCYLGEVALISHDSPISLSKILFYNTLFDENASCHLALGSAYPTNVVGGTDMNEEQMEAVGCNSSMTHVDFMFGSKCMNIVGVNNDDSEVVLFEKGNFVI